MTGKISEDPDKVVDGTEKVAASSGGSNYGILISSIKTWVLSSISGLTTAMFAANVVDTDTTLAANSDARLASQKAVKAYADALIAANDAMVFKGATDCSANPNYPAADRGHTYRVSVAGKIGGASGVVVEVGDMFICNTDATSTGNQATVGANWNVIQTNIDGAVTGPASATSGRLATFNGTTGKILQDGGAAISTDGTFASNVDTKIPTEKAVKTYVDAASGSGGAWTTYTPTVTAQSGTITTASAAGRYKQIGKIVFLQVDITITTAGSGAGGVIATLPSGLSAAANKYIGCSYEYASTGASGAAVIGNISTSQVYARGATGTSFIVSGQAVAIGITYEVP